MSKAFEDQLRTKLLTKLLERDRCASWEIEHYFRPVFHGHNITVAISQSWSNRRSLNLMWS